MLGFPERCEGAMEEQRNSAYRGFEMSPTVGGEPTAGFHVVA